MVNERYKFTTIWSPFSYRGNARKGVRAAAHRQASVRQEGGVMMSVGQLGLDSKKNVSVEGLVNLLKTKWHSRLVQFCAPGPSVTFSEPFRE